MSDDEKEIGDLKQIIDENVFFYLDRLFGVEDSLNISEGISFRSGATEKKGILYEACKHALTGGKRVRSSISLGIIGNNLSRSSPASEEQMLAAVSIEYLHAASLIIDDLPCMDNDTERRGMPSVHIKYGERVAQLASTTLMAIGIESIARAVDVLDKGEALFLIKFVAEKLGPFGASGGEMDEFIDGAKADVEKIINMKTSTFFEISFVIGWLFGGRSLSRQDNGPVGSLGMIGVITQCARYLGLAYQIADDLEDIDRDTLAIAQGASVVNYAIKYGKTDAINKFHKSTALFYQILPKEAHCLPIDYVITALNKKVNFFN